VALPALRERLEDIPLLAEEFLRRYLERATTGPAHVAKEACAVLMQHDWPGNLRQLRNVVEAAAAVATAEEAIGMAHVIQFLPPLAREEGAGDDLPTLAEARARAELRLILEAITRAGGNRGRAAKLLRISEATLYRKLGRGRSQDRESPPRVASPH
jgi:transcriptional regulator with PAS, ATPase and Fis domain